MHAASASSDRDSEPSQALSLEGPEVPEEILSEDAISLRALIGHSETVNASEVRATRTVERSGERKLTK